MKKNRKRDSETDVERQSLKRERVRDLQKKSEMKKSDRMGRMWRDIESDRDKG